MDFREIFASGRYHREMKIMKILASTPSGSEIMAFLKNDQIDDGIAGGQTQQFLT